MTATIGSAPLLSATREYAEQLYLDYAELLDAARLDEWIDLFTEDATYQAISSENVSRGLPLATMRCDSRGMLADRVYAIKETSMYAPRIMRHIVGRLRLTPGADGLTCRANFLVCQTIGQGSTQLFASGVYDDLLVEDGARLRFARKRAVIDSPMVLNSLIFPL